MERSLRTYLPQAINTVSKETMSPNAESDLCLLAQILLECAVLGRPLPGHNSTSCFFPDAEIVTQLDTIVVSSRYISSDCQLKIPDKEIVILSDEELALLVESKGDFPYFTLSEGKLGRDEATITLQLSWRVSEANQQAGRLYLGGGGMRVRFQMIDGKWQAPAGPIATFMS